MILCRRQSKEWSKMQGADFESIFSTEDKKAAAVRLAKGGRYIWLLVLFFSVGAKLIHYLELFLNLLGSFWCTVFLCRSIVVFAVTHLGDKSRNGER